MRWRDGIIFKPCFLLADAGADRGADVACTGRPVEFATGLVGPAEHAPRADDDAAVPPEIVTGAVVIHLEPGPRPSGLRRSARLGGKAMIFPFDRVRLLVATKPIDFRKGHDGLSVMVSSVLRKEPFTGTVFVFCARRADRLKLLSWDGTGLVTLYKRLVASTFTWPSTNEGVMALNNAQFEALFAGLD